MSTTEIYQYPKPLPVVLGKRAAFFFFLAVIGFLLVKVVGPLLQTSPEYVVESIVSGIPLLIAIVTAITALTIAVVRRMRRTAA